MLKIKQNSIKHQIRLHTLKYNAYERREDLIEILKLRMRIEMLPLTFDFLESYDKCDKITLAQLDLITYENIS